MAFPHNVVILGSATIDWIEQPKRSYTKMGGVVTYAGLTFRKHGLKTSVVTCIAPQDEALLDVFAQAQIRCFNGVTDTTTCFQNTIEGDARRQKLPSRATPITPDHALPALQNTPHIHLGPLHDQAFDETLFDVITQQNGFVSLDIQGYVRTVEGDQVGSGVSPLLPQALHCADMIKGDEDELDLILESLQCSISDLIQAFNLKEIIVTEGSKGGRVISQSGQRFPYRSHPVEHVVDTTGAGDVFFAAYLTERHHHNRSIVDATTHAAAITAQHVAGHYIPERTLILDLVRI